MCHSQRSNPKYRRVSVTDFAAKCAMYCCPRRFHHSLVIFNWWGGFICQDRLTCTIIQENQYAVVNGDLGITGGGM